MAIPFQSNLNNMIAVGVQSATGAVDDIASISGGTMPEGIRNQIANIISDSMDLNGGITSEVYSIVAGLMTPFTPSLDANSLIAVLKSTSVFGNISSGSFNVGSIIDDNLNMFINQYELDLLKKVGGFDAILGKFGISDGLGAIVTELTGDVKSVVYGFLGNILSTDELSKVSPDVVGTFLRGDGIVNLATDLPEVSDISGLVGADQNTILELVGSTVDADGNLDLSTLTGQQRDTYAAAYVKSASGSDTSISGISGIMAKTRGTIAGTVEQTEDLPTPNPFPIDADTIDPYIHTISSVEELESEMASITRDVCEMVVHWSETYTNSNLSGDQLEELTGAGGNAYHLIIRRDGSVERGANLNSIADHTEGHNEFSLGVCFVGGLNVASGSSNLFEVASARSITLSQYNSFYQIMRTFFMQFPGGQALGHMDIDANQEDPGFDVREYAFNNFNKQSLYTNAFKQQALSPSDLLNTNTLNNDTDALERNF